MKKITMKYPNDESNELYDGRRHQISPISLIRIVNTNYYIMEYMDETIGITCVTILRRDGSRFLKIPLDNYDLLIDELNTGNLPLKKEDIEIVLGNISTIDTASITSTDWLISEIKRPKKPQIKTPRPFQTPSRTIEPMSPIYEQEESLPQKQPIYTTLEEPQSPMPTMSLSAPPATPAPTMSLSAPPAPPAPPALTMSLSAPPAPPKTSGMKQTINILLVLREINGKKYYDIYAYGLVDKKILQFKNEPAGEFTFFKNVKLLKDSIPAAYIPDEYTTSANIYTSNGSMPPILLNNLLLNNNGALENEYVINYILYNYRFQKEYLLDDKNAGYILNIISDDYLDVKHREHVCNKFKSKFEGLTQLKRPGNPDIIQEIVQIQEVSGGRKRKK